MLSCQRPVAKFALHKAKLKFKIRLPDEEILRDDT
jgi:hypothetical protein